MARRSRNKTPLYSKGKLLRWIDQDQVFDLLETKTARRLPGNTGLCLIDTKPKSYHMPATGISFCEMEMNAGVWGPEMFFNTDICPISKAKRKIEAWPEIHDDRAVCICAGSVCQPAAPEAA